MATIELFGHSVQASDDTVLRIISAAWYNLNQCKKQEKGQFPIRDQAALKICLDLLYCHDLLARRAKE